MREKPCIIFVYNADSGLFNTVSDIAHKIFSPETYSCNLCAITYGNFGMRAEWKTYLESLEADFEFLHRDELADKYGFPALALPTILLKNGETVAEWINAGEINRCHSLDDLKRLISRRLAGLAR
ncbi:MAG: hypothetical protein FIB02_06230 [Desulfuromonas sp.]|nr:hypothetical protein [Desulfuromonas sp.]